MTRPRKQTVDWFPHKCNHGATIFILESKYQEAGYAFWFKLLEVLGSTDGHLIDCKEEKRFEYLCAYTKTQTDACIERLDLLARMEAIDRELWTGSRVIWCQNFVDGIHAAYRNRELPAPHKPSYERDLPGLGGISSARNPQRKEGEEGIEEREEEIGPSATPPPSSRNKLFIPPTKGEVIAYANEIGYALDPDKFLNAYEQKGWMVGKAKMKNWKAAVRNWKSNGWGQSTARQEDKYARGFNDRDPV